VPPPAEGIASRAARGESWADTALINPQQLRLLPYGEPDAAARAGFERQLQLEPDWLLRQLAQIELDGEPVCLIDTARLPSVYAAQALAAAHCVLGVIAPDLPSLAAAQRLPIPAAEQHFAWVLNRFDPRLRLQQDLRTLMNAHLPGDAPMFVVHRDESLPEAQAADQPLAEYAPHCQAIFDLQAISAWLLAARRAGAMPA
jgi:cellulose synthase operon protein YhjQ